MTYSQTLDIPGENSAMILISWGAFTEIAIGMLSFFKSKKKQRREKALA